MSRPLCVLCQRPVPRPRWFQVWDWLLKPPPFCDPLKRPDCTDVWLARRGLSGGSPQ